MRYSNHRSYLPGNLHRHAYGAAARYGSGYQRVYGNGSGVPASELSPAAANVARSLSASAQEVPAVPGRPVLA